MRPSRLTRLFPWFAPLLLAACNRDGGPVGPQPTGPAAVRVAAGGGQADSVDAVLAAPLVAEVRDSSNVPLANVAVTFASAGEGGTTGVQFAAPAEGAFVPTLVVRTDTSGRATARVKLPTASGAARARVTVGTLADSAEFQVSPGAALRLELSPRDTTLYPGTFTLAASGRDRYGNPAPVQATASPRIAVEGDRVRADVIGRHYVALQSGTLRDTAWISAVPAGTIAFKRQGWLAVVNLDGSGYRNLLPGAGYHPTWSTDGTQITVQTDSLVPGFLYSVGTSGGKPYPNLHSQMALSPVWPRWPTGESIYFAGVDYVPKPTRGPLFSMRYDGTNLRQHTTPAAGEWHRRPSTAQVGLFGLVFTRVVSPTLPADGQTGTLTVLDMSRGTEATTSLNVQAEEGRWSPAGAAIAFVSGGNLMLINSDRSGLRLLAAGMGGDVEWSPSGEYLVARNATGLVVVVAATGEVIPLSFTDATYSQPAWRPCPSIGGCNQL
jgi:hypothetical protein